jgi:hypothetical protein
VFQARQGGDSFLVYSPLDCMLYLYVVVDKLLHPSAEAVDELQDKPYFWVKRTGMIYVLSEVSQRSFGHIEDAIDAGLLLLNMEVGLETV